VTPLFGKTSTHSPSSGSKSKTSKQALQWVRGARLYGITTQKTVLYIITADITSNPTLYYFNLFCPNTSASKLCDHFLWNSI
jgi:hypothetical protein